MLSLFDGHHSLNDLALLMRRNFLPSAAPMTVKGKRCGGMLHRENVFLCTALTFPVRRMIISKSDTYRPANPQLRLVSTLPTWPLVLGENTRSVCFGGWSDTFVGLSVVYLTNVGAVSTFVCVR